MPEYDWEAIARCIEEGRAPRPLPEMLKAIYDLGAHHGSGWSVDDEVERLGALMRQAADT